MLIAIKKEVYYVVNFVAKIAIHLKRRSLES
jgi:hypothetical protein